MENLNEGKKKRGGMAYEAALREIDAQSAVVALEAKIEKLKEMAETKTNRLNMVSEDENLSELIDKKAMNEMRKEIKQIEKMQEKLEKLYEKKNGKMPKAKEVVDEEEKVDETYSASTYEEDDSVSEGGYDSTYEEDDSVKEETNEEMNRWQKLAGIPLKENLLDKIENIEDYNKTEDSLKYKKYDVTYDKDEKMYSVFLRKGSGDSSDMPEFESSSSEKVKNFLEKH